MDMQESKRRELDVESGPVVSVASPGRLPLEAPPAYANPPSTTPPQYTNDGPPAYDSIFGKVKQAKAESDGNVDYACKVFAMICCGTICALIQIVFCLAIPIACIVIGSMNLDNCPQEKYIPIYLIVAGVFGVVKGIVNFIFFCVEKLKKKNNDDDEDGEDKKKKPNPIDQLLNCFLFAWFIAGSVWVYRIHGDVNYAPITEGGEWCDKTTYLFTFWVITIGYIFMALGILCCCGVCAIMCCVAIGSASSD